MTRKKRLTPKQLERMAEKFNQDFPVGAKVLLRKDTGEIETTVKRPAIVMGFHSAVAWFEGVSGCYDINGRVRPASSRFLSMRNHHHTDRHIKLKWLVANRNLWEGWIHPGDPRRRNLVQRMRDADLIAKSTYWLDVNLNNLIQDARALMRKEQVNANKRSVKGIANASKR